MPPIYVVLAAVAVAVSIPLVILSVASGDAGVFARRREKGERVSDAGSFILEGSAGERVVAPAFASLFRMMRRVTPGGVVDSLDRKVQLAGINTTAEFLLVSKVVLAALGFFGIYELMDGDLLPSILGGVAGFLLPDRLVESVAKERQGKILLALPQVIDQLRMSVEAGVGFEAAVGRAAEAGSGPLADELRRSLQEMQIGASRTEALRHLVV